MTGLRNGNGALLAGLVLCLALTQAGCSRSGDGGIQRFDVSGRVLFNGQPVPFGQILFSPDRSQGNEGPQGIAEIRNGAYDTKTGKGTVGGPHLVRISGFGSDPKAGNEDNPVPALFPDYETAVELPKQLGTLDFEVPAG